MRQKNQFPKRNVYGLPGRIFGNHRHQRGGRKVMDHHSEWKHDVRIRWANGDWERRSFGYSDGPFILPNDVHWAMFNSDLDHVENGLNFPVTEHCRDLQADESGRKPVILEWGCGNGNAVKDLAQDPEIQQNALVYGYGDVWDVDWNNVEGVKFLFFVKEHLIEYFRRTRQKINFVYSHGAMEYLKHADLIKHLEGLAALMDPGTKVVLSQSYIRKKAFWELKDFFPPAEDKEQITDETPLVLTRK